MSMGISTARDAWLAERRKGIGASDAPTVVGVRTTPSRFRLWMEKRGEIESEPPNEAMDMGLAAEDSIAKMYQKRTGRVIDQTQDHVAHATLPWMKATIDGWDTDGNLVEFKLAGSYTTRKLPEDGDSAGLPEPWIIQLHHQMFVTGKNKAFLAAWCADPSFRLYEIEADLGLMNTMVTLEESFWQQVVDGTPPAEFGVDDIKAITRHFSRETGESIELPTELERTVEEFKEGGERIRELGKVADTAKARLLLAMGNASVATCGPYTLKRKVVQVKERTQTIKASSYIRFTCSNGDSDE
jgi:putative phage-type endonuclease